MWLLAFLFSVTSGQECPSYTCSSDYTTKACISQESNDTNTYSLTVCNPEYVCPTTLEDNTAYCTLRTHQVNYPGEFCSTASECTSGICISSICRGLVSGNTCTQPYDCNPGLYCDEKLKVCKTQIVLGQSCSKTYQCVNNALCIEGKCATFFSLSNGAYLDDLYVNKTTGFNYVCKSGYALYSDGIFNCTVAPKSPSALPVKCTIGKDCLSSDRAYPKECVCGINDDGESYCPLFEGDPIVQSMISNWVSINALNEKCNAQRRWGYECFSTMSASSLTAWYNWAAGFSQYYYEYYPLIWGNNDCAKQIYTSDYWSLLTAKSQLQQPQCPQYFCGTEKTNWDTEQCIFYEKTPINYMIEDVLYLSNCEGNQTCTATGLMNSTCAPTVSALRYGGDYCQASTDCVSGVCTNNVCLGGVLGANCTNPYDCNPGLYCNDVSKCDSQVTEGGKCNSQYDCLNSMTCNQGICVPYFSLPVQSVTNNLDASGLSLACYYGFANVTQSSPLKGICARPPVSPSTEPTVCTPGSICSDKTGTYKKPCTCGYNEFGLSYCPAFEGDSSLKNAIFHMKSLSSFNSKCNTMSRFSEYCYLRDLKHLEEFYYFSTNFTMYKQLPYFQKNNECVKTIYTAEFWRQVGESYDHSDGVLLGMLSVFVGYFLI